MATKPKTAPKTKATVKAEPAPATAVAKCNIFTPNQIAALEAPLDSKNVSQRSQSGRKLSYIEGWHAIAEANRIFGHGNWSRETFELKCVSERERSIGQERNPGWGVTYIARVRITICVGCDIITRDGSGAGHGIDRDLGQAHESALKEAETDAMKRALITFGWPFGLALYDKSQENVSIGDSPKSAAKANGKAPAEKPTAEKPAAKVSEDESIDTAQSMINEIANIASEKALADFSKKNGTKYQKLQAQEQQNVRDAMAARKQQLQDMAVTA